MTRTLPVLMSAPMVIMTHRDQDPKTVTRRIVRNQPPADCGEIVCGEYHPTVLDRHGNEAPGTARFGAYSADGTWSSPSPYGQPGDELWLREAWRTEKSLDKLNGTQIAERAIDAGYRAPWAPIQYEADGARRDWTKNFSSDGTTTPGRPRLARFMPRWASRTRLLVTGVRVERLHDITDSDAWAEGIDADEALSMGCTDHAAVAAYSALWERINGEGSWDLNPLVWAIDFRRATR